MVDTHFERGVMLKLLKRRYRLHGDRGASALLIAGSMVLIMAVAAIAIDASAGFVERRGDQSAVDIGTMAGAMEVVVGTSGGGVSEDSIVSEALSYTRSNLPKSYSDTEWQDLWEGCVDPASARNAESDDNFEALNPPSSWTVTDPTNWCVSVDSAKSLLRVRTPDQVIDTTFGNVIGFDSLRTHASAVANLQPGDGNILPFGFPSSAGDGLHCLSSGPTGLADDPCSGPTSGSFGTLKVRRFTPSPYQGCNVAPLNSVLALNIAAGSDHTIVPDSDGDPANEVRDICYNFLVDTLERDPGFPQGTEWGLATGDGLPSGETARLQQGSQNKHNVAGNNLEDEGLWRWLLDGLDYNGSTTSTTDDAPMFCDPDGFTSGSYDVDYDGTAETTYDFDVPPDSIDDPLESWQHMRRCLEDYAAEPPGTYAVIFSPDLGDKDGGNWSARFGYAPQFWESDLSSTWLHIKRYRAIFIQGTWWKGGMSWVVHSPGEACSSCGNSSYSLQQVSAFIIPDDALPAELRGDPPSSGVGFINPFKVDLAR